MVVTGRSKVFCVPPQFHGTRVPLFGWGNELDGSDLKSMKDISLVGEEIITAPIPPCSRSSSFGRRYGYYRYHRNWLRFKGGGSILPLLEQTEGCKSPISSPPMWCTVFGETTNGSVLHAGQPMGFENPTAASRTVLSDSLRGGASISIVASP